jgi:hypothetical protein
MTTDNVVRLDSIRCPNCGALLEVTAAAQFVRCHVCGAVGRRNGLVDVPCDPQVPPADQPTRPSRVVKAAQVDYDSILAAWEQELAAARRRAGWRTYKGCFALIVLLLMMTSGIAYFLLGSALLPTLFFVPFTFMLYLLARLRFLAVFVPLRQEIDARYAPQFAAVERDESAASPEADS